MNQFYVLQVQHLLARVLGQSLFMIFRLVHPWLHSNKQVRANIAPLLLNQEMGKEDSCWLLSQIRP